MMKSNTVTKKRIAMKRFILPAVLLLASACSKDISSYQNDPRAYFYDQTTGVAIQQITERTFTFAPYDATVVTDTQYIPVKIAGLPANTDRTFAARVITDSSTAVEGRDYQLLHGTIKANAITGTLPLVLHRTTMLKDSTLHLRMAIADSADFKAGAVEDNFYTMIWNDALIKPNNWDTRPGIAQFFGTYSLVKYQFIIATLHKSQFDILTTRVYDPTKVTTDQMYDYDAQLKSALKVYNSTHTPALTDEFGVLVTFP